MNDIEKTLFDIIAKEAQIPREKITLDATMQDLDVHSLDAIQVVFEIEDRFGISVPEKDANFNTSTVGDLLRAVQELVTAKGANALA
ncbi:acyl carrier protein [Roseateles sp. DAIF2]|uniref:acyl carrier protein n=1 Tax=Roseateles sp. DAIF2 TaxID=2714952 RepID=UPI0018A2A8F7|nr:acyl carrier protein [Roseateles sp. DAIF2]QPF75602.1 acyl carrier protein [Roseateles sp. DAIF2]